MFRFLLEPAVGSIVAPTTPERSPRCSEERLEMVRSMAHPRFYEGLEASAIRRLLAGEDRAAVHPGRELGLGERIDAGLVAAQIVLAQEVAPFAVPRAVEEPLAIPPDAFRLVRSRGA